MTCVSHSYGFRSGESQVKSYLHNYINIVQLEGLQKTAQSAFNSYKRQAIAQDIEQIDF